MQRLNFVVYSRKCPVTVRYGVKLLRNAVVLHTIIFYITDCKSCYLYGLSCRETFFTAFPHCSEQQ
jgi:hypothetical protein